MEKDNFNFECIPGKCREKEPTLLNQKEPVISIITAFYNGGKYLEQTANSIFNQTFPYWEWIIVDDGSTNSESLEIIEEVSKQDERIKILHKENGGLADTRDFGAENCSKCTKYLVFLDEDDLLDKTYLECAYWTLETNQDATWAYTDVVNFDGIQYIWKKWFDSKQEQKENLLVATAMIKKEDFWSVNGYELKEKAVNEDWNLWLKFLARGKKPVHMNFNGFWYRRKPADESELYKSMQNKKIAMEIISATSKTIEQPITAIQYPKYDYNWDIILEKPINIDIPQYENTNKIKILMLIPWMTMGGADKFNLDLLAGLDKNKYEVTLVSTVPNQNEWKQKFEKQAKFVYDLTTFLDQKYWTCFIEYLINKNNIDLVLNTNSTYGYSVLPYIKAKYPQIPIIDYIHMEEWYNRNGGYSRDTSGVTSVIDKTYVCNANSEKILIDYFGKKKEEVETVYIGVDEEKFNPKLFNKEELLKKYNIPNNKKVISYIARIDLQKRPHLLMQIVKELKQKRNDFVFVIAGNGPLLHSIKSEAKKFGITDNIIFLGAVSNTGEIYAISDMTINCSIKEGLALTAYESLSMDVPVVSADVGGQRELITEETGVIVPCMQTETEISNFDYSTEEIMSYVIATEKVLDNLAVYKEKCRNKILNGFTIKQMQTKMADIIERTVKNPNKEKMETGQSLIFYKDITKELITKYFVSSKAEYSWLCYDYNAKTYGWENGSKYSKLKGQFWANPIYRFFVKALKATGIVALMKKFKLDKKVKGFAKKIIK